MCAYRQRIRLRADFFEDSEIWSETDEGVISVGCESRDRQPGFSEARSTRLPDPALDSRQSVILFRTTLAESSARHGHQHDGHGDDDVIDRPCQSQLPELRAEQVVMLAVELSHPVVPARRRRDFPVAAVPRDDFGSFCAATSCSGLASAAQACPGNCPVASAINTIALTAGWKQPGAAGDGLGRKVVFDRFGFGSEFC